MKNTKLLYKFIPTMFMLFILSGCHHDTGFTPVGLDPDFFEKEIEEANSVVNELTPIITIGDDVAVAVYKCSTTLDCYRCQNGDVYFQECANGTCQGDLIFGEDCPEDCSAGECVENDDVLVGEEFDGVIGEDYDLNPKGAYNDAIVDNDDLLPVPDGFTKFDPPPIEVPVGVSR